MSCVRTRCLTLAIEGTHHLAMTDTARETIEQDDCVQYPGNGQAVGSGKGHGQ